MKEIILNKQKKHKEKYVALVGNDLLERVDENKENLGLDTYYDTLAFGNIIPEKLFHEFHSNKYKLETFYEKVRRIDSSLFLDDYNISGREFAISPGQDTDNWNETLALEMIITYPEKDKQEILLFDTNEFPFLNDNRTYSIKYTITIPYEKIEVRRDDSYSLLTSQQLKGNYNFYYVLNEKLHFIHATLEYFIDGQQTDYETFRNDVWNVFDAMEQTKNQIENFSDYNSYLAAILDYYLVGLLEINEIPLISKSDFETYFNESPTEELRYNTLISHINKNSNELYDYEFFYNICRCFGTYDKYIAYVLDDELSK